MTTFKSATYEMRITESNGKFIIEERDIGTRKHFKQRCGCETYNTHKEAFDIVNEVIRLSNLSEEDFLAELSAAYA